MPKQFRNNKKILAATVLTTALSIAPIVSNADQPANPGQGPLPLPTPSVPAESQLPADLAEPKVYNDKHGNIVYDYSEENLDAGIGQPAEPDEGPVVSTPTVDKFGNTGNEQGHSNPDVGQPAEKGEGPIVSMPMVDQKGNTIYGKYNKTSANKVSTNKVSKVSTTQNLNPKTGDSSMIGYVGLGLSSALGLFRKRK